MKKEDLSYMQDRIEALEDFYQKKNIGEMILTAASRMITKSPTLKDHKDVVLERSFGIVQAMLDKSKGFDVFEWVIPIAMKPPSDWNGRVISDVITAWQTGSEDVRDRLVAEGRIIVHDGKPVSRVIRSAKDEDGSFIILEAEYVDTDREDSIPLPRDTKKEFKPGSPNFNYGRPVYPRYHIDVYCLVGISVGDQTESRLAVIRYQGDVADPSSDNYAGNLIWSKVWKKYENVRSQLVRDDGMVCTYNGNTTIWDKESADENIDLLIGPALDGLENVRSAELADLEHTYKTFFISDGKVKYDRIALSEVTIKETGTDNFGRTVIQVRDSSMTDPNEPAVRAYLDGALEFTPPELPCRAIVSYYIKQRDGKYDFKLRQKVEGKTYELGVTGVMFIKSSGLSKEDMDALQAMMGE